MNQDLIVLAKQKLTLTALLVLLGLGDHAKKSARCPFHDDTSASFSLYVGDDGEERWKCFAGCGQGDAIDFLAKHRGLSNPDACREFIRLAGVTPPPAPPPGSDSSPSAQAFCPLRR
jgi:DNA primase